MLILPTLGYAARELKRAAAIAILGTLYGAAAFLGRRLVRRRRPPPQRAGRILVIGTFHNPNWFHSHIRPLVRSRLGEVVLVCDEEVAGADGVRFECPPGWLRAILTRAGAKFVWALRCALREPPDLFMGYHVFPGALMALALARLFGRPACYQATAGPSELEGGGWNVENRLLTALQRPSAFVERRAQAMVREIDSVVVRGSGAAAYMRRIGCRGSVAVITGSVDPVGPSRGFAERSIDLAFVGRLVDIKQPERFIALVAALAGTLPALRAAVIGDGPQADMLKAMAREAGIEPNVAFLGQRADVDALIADARVFVLCSRSEGVSIAMLEAMAAGAVPVVADVGDLRDFVHNEVNGYVVPQADIAAYAQAAAALLTREALWRSLSQRAVRSALDASGVEAIANRWHQHLRAVMAGRPAAGDLPSSTPA